VTNPQDAVVVIDARGYFLRDAIGDYTRHLVRQLVASHAGGQLRLLIPPGRHAEELGFTTDSVLAPPVQILASRARWMHADEEDQWLDDDIAGADLFHSLTGHWLPRGEAVRSVATLHDLSPVLRPRLASPSARELASRVARHLEHASHLVVASHSTAADARAVLAGRVPPMTVIPGAASPLFRPGAPLGDTLQRYALQPDGFLLANGVFTSQGIFDRLLAAHAQSGVATPLVVAGAYDEAVPALRAIVATQDAASRVRLIGEVADEALAALSVACRAFVYPAPPEGLGLPVLQALSCGAAVVAARTSSIPEITGDAALLADPARTRSLVSALKRIDSDGALRDQLRRLAVVRAAAFSWPRTAAATLGVYHSVLEARAA
jgi:glycosyltransferase involved in cell wall biosynthesis